MMQNQFQPLPHIAILMATYNGEKYLKEQIDSILAQKNVQVSLFVRDDNSVDQTRSIIEEYAATTGKVFLLPTKPLQLNVTKNFFRYAVIDIIQSLLQIARRFFIKHERASCRSSFKIMIP